MSQPSVKLSSLKCRMTALSVAIQIKEEKIHRALNKVKTLFAANPDVAYMAPDVLLELIRSRLMKVTPMVDQIIKMLKELEDSQKELNNVIIEFDKFVVI